MSNRLTKTTRPDLMGYLHMTPIQAMNAAEARQARAIAYQAALSVLG